MELNTAEIEVTDRNMPEYEDVLRCLAFLFGTKAGTYPTNRDFGIDTDVMDKPLSIIKTMLAVEYHTKVERYEPRVEVTDVTFSVDPDSGKVTPHIEIAPVDAEEEDDSMLDIEDEEEVEDE